MKNFILTALTFILITVLTAKAGNAKIVYTSDNTNSGYFQIFIMNDDGSKKKQITDLTANCSHPKWSQDGTKIVFQTDDERIYLINNANEELPDEPIYIYGGTNPSFTANGNEIIFNSEMDGVLTIYLIDIEEGEPYILSVLGYSNQQVLSRDGKKLVFSAFNEGNKCVMMMDLEDTTENYLSQISINDNANLVPDVSSFGNIIVYASFNNQLNGTIYVYKGGKETPLTKGITSSNQPKISPDESKIAFTVINNTSVKLYTMNIDGSEKNALSIPGGNIGSFIWFDNNRIIYDMENGSKFSIGIININTGKNTLVASESNCLHPDGFILKKENIN
jgi:Tol biopolymer transport system component